MFTTGHLLFGVAAVALLGLTGASAAAFLIATVLVDLDLLFVWLGRADNHRRLITHCPLTYAPLLLLAPLWSWVGWMVAGLGLHFALDFLDYGVRAHPFSRRLMGLRLMAGPERGREHEHQPVSEYLKGYFRHPVMLSLEGAGLAAAVVLGLL